MSSVHIFSSIFHYLVNQNVHFPKHGNFMLGFSGLATCLNPIVDLLRLLIVNQYSCNPSILMRRYCTPHPLPCFTTIKGIKNHIRPANIRPRFPKNMPTSSRKRANLSSDQIPNPISHGTSKYLIHKRSVSL